MESVVRAMVRRLPRIMTSQRFSPFLCSQTPSHTGMGWTLVRFTAKTDLRQHHRTFTLQTRTFPKYLPYDLHSHRVLKEASRHSDSTPATPLCTLSPPARQNAIDASTRFWVRSRSLTTSQYATCEFLHGAQRE